ncbi:MAG: hypothetical protein EXX96DRAFT_540245 [Benjaminiella poitrasii]|nr:MAG: hypothetical protein EXX96DRAFT_540245 [Benjaminiella poitrasii]
MSESSKKKERQESKSGSSNSLSCPQDTTQKAFFKESIDTLGDQCAEYQNFSTIFALTVSIYIVQTVFKVFSYVFDIQSIVMLLALQRPTTILSNCIRSDILKMCPELLTISCTANFFYFSKFGRLAKKCRAQHMDAVSGSGHPQGTHRAASMDSLLGHSTY